MSKRTSVSLIIGATALAVLPHLAAAQVVATEHAPFAMPDLVASNVLGAELGYVNLGVKDSGEYTDIVNLDLHGQFEVVPGAVLFGRLPLSYMHENDTSEADAGNLTLGARGVMHQDNIHYAGSIAVALPTAPDIDVLGGNDGVAALLSGFGRFDLFGRYGPETTTYYVQGHIRQDMPLYFLQGQLGYERLDVRGNDALDLLRFAVSGGYKASEQMTLIGEFTNVSMHLDGDVPDGDEKLFHWMRGGLRYTADKTTIGGHLYVALDTPPFLAELSVWGLIFDVTTKL